MSVQFPDRRIPAATSPLQAVASTFTTSGTLRYGPLLAIALLLAMDAALGLDQRLADALYAWQGQRWALRHALLTEGLIHRAGRIASLLAWLAVLAAWLAALRVPSGRPWRKPLAYLLVSTLACAALIAWIKSWSNMDCPWDLVRYGGNQPWVGLLQVRPPGLERGHCFPAAHAGTGYAWVALYFCLAAVRPRWRNTGLLVALVAGGVFGIAQQLRGAHFLSHDLVSLGLCWTVAVALQAAFWPAAGSAR